MFVTRKVREWVNEAKDFRIMLSRPVSHQEFTFAQGHSLYSLLVTSLVNAYYVRLTKTADRAVAEPQR